MAYHTYTTEAVVFEVRDRMGSDRMVRLMTQDAGMLDARATGVREEKSKMRYALQPFSVVRVTLVRGKREWRLTGAESILNMYFSAHDRQARGALLKLSKLVTRVVTGEEQNNALYETVRDALMYIREDGCREAFLIGAFRILTTLGYVAPHTHLSSVAHAPTASRARTFLTPPLAEEIDRTIEHALTVSQL